MADDLEYYGAHGIGNWDKKTKRYVPIGGGSRSRLELEIKGLRPYRGFSGVDSLDKVKIDSINSLYAKLDQRLHKFAQSNAYLSAPKTALEIEQITSMAVAESQMEQKARAAEELQVEREASAAVKIEVEQEASAAEEPQVEPEVAAQEELQAEQEASAVEELQVEQEASAALELQVEQEAAAREEPITGIPLQVEEKAPGPSTSGIPDDFEL